MENYIEIFRHISDKSTQYNNYVTCRVQLPTCNNKNIEWTKTIGYIFDFSYQGVDGYLTIVDYNVPKSKIYFTINDSNIIYTIGLKAFKRVGFNEVIRIRYHKYEIGEIVKNKEILEVSYKGKSIIYKYKCIKDGYIGNTTQQNIEKSIGLCPVCTNCVIIEGINDIPTTDPWMIPYFPGGYDEAKLYGANSKQIVELQCPHCGRLKSMPIIDVHKNKGFSCECSDNISYPEKCMLNLLDMLDIAYNYQCGSSILRWLKSNYHYDFYIPILNMIIETNGKQHYKELSNKSKWTSLDVIKERDLYKKNAARINGIKYYVELDCSKSNIVKFKESVMNSELPALFNFTENDIDWNKIDQLSTRNIIKEICEYKNDHPSFTLQEVADNFSVSKRNLNQYYRIGEKFGWCNYNMEEIRWVAHFHRNTHYCINGYYFYNMDEITARSMEIFGEKIYGKYVAGYVKSSTKNKLFKNKYEIRVVSHKEYLSNNKNFPSYISKEIIDGLLFKYSQYEENTI